MSGIGITLVCVHVVLLVDQLITWKVNKRKLGLGEYIGIAIYIYAGYWFINHFFGA